MSTITQQTAATVETTTCVTLDHVGARYEGDKRMSPVEALCDITLDIRAGEVLSLIGPSGCGKTTLLNIIAGLQAPTTGRVLIEGDELKEPRPDQIALVFQDYSLLPWRNVCANVELALEFAGVAKRERRDRAMTELSKVGLTQFANAYPRQLSGGMRQRVAIARAMVVNTPIVLLDEPFGALDEQTRTVLGEELSRLLADSGKTIVLITHSLSEAAFLSDRIAVMGRRPGTIRTILDLSEPHPRTQQFMTSAMFHQTRDSLFELLHAEMVAAVDDVDDLGDVR